MVIKAPEAPFPSSWNHGGGRQTQPYTARPGSPRQKGGARTGKRTGSYDDALTLSASLSRVPVMELTPAVQAALDALMLEMETLRWHLERSESRQRYLETLADRDSYLPVLNRRAVMRELARLIDRAEQAGSGGALVLMRVQSFDSARRVWGMAAAEAMMTEISHTLLAHTEPTDVVGHIDAGDLVVVLILPAFADAEARARELTIALTARPFRWRGRQRTITVDTAVRTFGAGDGAEQVLDELDRELRARESGRAAVTAGPGPRGP